MAKIAFLLGPGFEDSEMKKPYDALREAGHEAVIVGLKEGEKLEGKNKKASYKVEKAISDINAKDFDGAVIPGGSSPEAIRMDKDVQAFVRELDELGKPISAICHGPQVLISADILKGRTLTSYPALEHDLVNAGATFKNEEVIVDRNLVTSRTPDDEPAFIRETLKVIDATTVSS
ncbi:type 1 glutamine amidotransferase domain-containing protein [Paenibacillus senegalensis]|uniref:type 1 glutamine amidotransferase domain-containing protein n=1 Tax=Paenibacillus senegalensis TaxID=1465766 RepID=UPI000288EED1|nr:type 1 glutamine amidotransferase domain-containing protein [Paenibacillus senegalensis]